MADINHDGILYIWGLMNEHTQRGVCSLLLSEVIDEYERVCVCVCVSRH